MLLCGLASFIFLLAAAVDPAWVTSKRDTQYTTPSGPKTGQAVSHFGLSAAVATAPTFDNDAEAEYDITFSIPSGPAVQQINTQNKAFDGPTAVRAGAATCNPSRRACVVAVVQDEAAIHESGFWGCMRSDSDEIVGSA